jgi:hypothetical protein
LRWLKVKVTRGYSGAEEPVLECAKPIDAWVCKACGERWTAPGTGMDGRVDQIGKRAIEGKNGRLENGKSHPATGQLFP